MTVVNSFAGWSDSSRALLARAVPPSDVVWTLPGVGGLFSSTLEGYPVVVETPHLPKSFLSIARRASFARGVEASELLYRIAWRLTHGDRNLLSNPADADVHALFGIDRSVRRDEHKMHAFVRFRQFHGAEGECFIAWHRPDHPILELAAPFFVRRFGSMRWSILTPDGSAHWDTAELRFGAGASENPVVSDDLEQVWVAYYGAIFNPARVKIRAMKKEMAVRHWKTLPETAIIGELLNEAPIRVRKMRARNQPRAEVESADSIDTLRDRARSCTACPLHCTGTGTVFGEGNPEARIVLVGEQPGDEEDVQGRPFVGPAGKVLNHALADAGLDRAALYVTNAVKHFKWEPRGKRRIHKKPSGEEVNACKPWLEAELSLVRPRVVVCLGATAAHSLFGKLVKIGESRGKVYESSVAGALLVTNHPSAILRIPDESAKADAYDALVATLRQARVLADRAEHAPCAARAEAG